MYPEHVERLKRRAGDGKRRQQQQQQQQQRSRLQTMAPSRVQGVGGYDGDSYVSGAGGDNNTEDDIGVYGDDDSLTATDTALPTPFVEVVSKRPNSNKHDNLHTILTTTSSDSTTSEIGLSQLFSDRDRDRDRRVRSGHRTSKGPNLYRATHTSSSNLQLPLASSGGDGQDHHHQQHQFSRRQPRSKLALANSSSDTNLNRLSSPTTTTTNSLLTASLLGRGSPTTFKSHYSSSQANLQYKKRRASSFWGRSISGGSSIFAFYAKRYAKEKLHLALRAFRTWYHKQITYHHLSKRMEFNQQLFEQWFRSKGQPLSLRALDHYDQVVIWIAGECFYIN